MNWIRLFKWSAVVMALGALSIATLIWLVFLPPNGNSINRVKLEEKVVALTFDDGPNPIHTIALLEVLKKYRVKATFFMTGKYVEAHPATVLAVAEGGHEISNHSYDATVLAFKSRRQIEDSIDRSDAALRRALGPHYTVSRFFRAPKGRQFLTLASILRDQGRTHVGASVLGYDWTKSSQRNPSGIARAVLEGLEPGDIIALHDGDDRVDEENRAGTVLAVAQILQTLEARGFRAVTVSELLQLSD
ncbi:MAG: polysaccharide deacetylase family protein [Verrucomicrobiales bacterium]